MPTPNGYEHVHGAYMEFGTFSLDPDTINANAESEVTTTLTGVRSGDAIFVSAEQLDTELIVKGARVTGTDEIGVTLRNLDSTDNIDGASKDYSYVVFRRKQSN